MQRPILCLLAVLALAIVHAALSPSASHAQIVDQITDVGEIEFDTLAETVYVNAAQCSAQDTTDVLATLGQDPGRDVYVWVGTLNSNCQLADNRGVTNAACGTVGGTADGRFEIGDDDQLQFTVAQLTAATTALDQEVVSCDEEGASLKGAQYTLFTFRDTPPGTTDVGPEGYGTADFTVDVRPPDPVTVTNDDTLRGSQFTITWEKPADLTQIEGYVLYQSNQSDVTDPAAATPIPGGTADQNAGQATVSASTMGLSEGESTFVSVQAIDQAMNAGDLSSPGTETIFVPSGGFCEATGECGCSASSLATRSTQSSLWGFVTLLLAAVLLLRRRFIR